MHVETHADARKVIHKDHLKVKEVVSVKGKTVYNCITRGKRGKRRVLSIVVPANAADKNHPNRPKTRKELNK